MSSTFEKNYSLFRSHFTPTIWLLLSVNVVVFLLQHVFLNLISVSGLPISEYIEQYFALQPIASDYFFPYWQAISYQFLHGGFTHILFNMLALWMFGSEVEAMWGKFRFLVFYLLCGVFGALAFLLFDMNSPAVGASGSVMGVLVAFGMMFPNRPIAIFPFFVAIPAKYLVALYALVDLLSGISSTSDGVAHFAHLGGALGGFLLVKFGDKIGVFSFFQNLFQSKTISRIEPDRIRATPSNRSSPIQRIQTSEPLNNQEILNSILDKINQQGFSSLTDEERRFLNEQSKHL